MDIGVKIFLYRCAIGISYAVSGIFVGNLLVLFPRMKYVENRIDFLTHENRELKNGIELLKHENSLRKH